jgi:23S rRNA (uridine2552-2'-O)-methyltransferase
MDHARSVYLGQQAAEVSYNLLKQGGTFVCKIFEGELIEEFITELRQYFSKIKRLSPQASRKSSSEIYIVSKQFKR